MNNKSPSVLQAINIATRIRAESEKDDINGIIYAAQFILTNLTNSQKKLVTLDEKVARQTVLNFVQHLLKHDQFEAAATILWGSGVYDWRPQSAADTWRCLFEHDKLLVQGAGAMGKTFNAAAWFLLDWMRDPEYTCIKRIRCNQKLLQNRIGTSRVRR
jgi:phage-related protein